MHQDWCLFQLFFLYINDLLAVVHNNIYSFAEETEFHFFRTQAPLTSNWNTSNQTYTVSMHKAFEISPTGFRPVQQPLTVQKQNHYLCHDGNIIIPWYKKLQGRYVYESDYQWQSFQTSAYPSLDKICFRRLIWSAPENASAFKN